MNWLTFWNKCSSPKYKKLNKYLDTYLAIPISRLTLKYVGFQRFVIVLLFLIFKCITVSEKEKQNPTQRDVSLNRHHSPQQKRLLYVFRVLRSCLL